MLEMGPHEQSVARQAYLTNEPLPERIQNAPVLKLGLNLYLMAFFDLDSTRSHAWGYQRIPWTAIKDYALANEFDAEQTENLIYYIRKMDSANFERLESAKGSNQ